MWPPRQKRNWKAILSVALLAVLCLGGAELLACRIADPALFDRITAPVQELAQSVSERVASLTEPRKEPETETTSAGDLEDQAADGPAIEDPLPVADPAVTELLERNGRRVLTGGSAEVVYYNQGEAPWADAPYGTDYISKYGCGPTAMSMVVSSLTQTAVDPAEMARWAYENGYWAKGSGSYLSIVEGTARAYGLMVEPGPQDAGELLQALSTGRLAVALMTKGHFTQGGHFILLRGITLDGGILVADPNSTDRSLVAWDPQLILDELSSSTSDGAPLWLLSAP